MIYSVKIQWEVDGTIDECLFTDEMFDEKRCDEIFYYIEGKEDFIRLSKPGNGSGFIVLSWGVRYDTLPEGSSSSVIRSIVESPNSRFT
ncbi:MAG: hypothetical protein Q8909_19290 [Bacteroidota bacterium]|nr:hypothetical protein [Bacteroidota bacterium]